MPFTQFTSLDFDEIKSSIKDYIRANTTFTDYGSFYDKNQKKMLREVENDEIDQKSKNIDNVINADTSGDFIID